MPNVVGAPRLPVPGRLPKSECAAAAFTDWFPGRRDLNLSGELACSGPPWQEEPFSWPAWLLPRPMVADL